MATLDDPTLETDCNTLASNIMSAATTKQNTYFGNKGRYFQGILTHDIIPADGVATAPDPTKHPYYTTDSYASLSITLPGTMKGAIALDIYNGPFGHGWYLRIMVFNNGKLFQKLIDGTGAEDFSTPWRRVG